MINLLVPICLISTFFCSSDGFRILGLFPIPGKSHMIMNSALMTELARRGHEVSVVSCFPLDNPPPNYKDFVLPDLYEEFQNNFMRQLNPYKENSRNLIKILILFHNFMTYFEETALQSNASQYLMDSDENFDLIIFENFVAGSFMGFLHKFDAPVIVISPVASMNFISDTIGNPYPYAYVPDLFTSYTDKMDFFQRLINTMLGNFNLLFRKLFTIPRQESIIKKYFRNPDSIPKIEELEKKIVMVIANSHFTFSGPRPNLPNLIEAGGLHIKPPKPLPNDIREFLDNSKDGAIYFSLGTNLRGTDFPNETRDAFLKAFSELKQNVLWKWNDDSLIGISKNVKIGKWFPQNDILGHPNLVLFMTHGGLYSTQEAVYHGVPLLGFPVFGDQQSNMHRSVTMGFGVQIDVSNITKESVSWAINEVINNSRYRETIRHASKVFKDQPMTPLETAVFWTEYVIRHKGAPHMRSAALDLNWFQYFLLDVILFIWVVCVASIYVFYRTFSFGYRRLIKIFRNKSKSKKQN